MTWPGVAGVTTIVTMALLPAANTPRLQFTGPLPVQFPCVVVADTNAIPAGSVSATVTFVAAAGPLLVAMTRYERLTPACPGFGEAVLVSERSALDALTTFNVAGSECNVTPDSPLMLKT